MNTIVALSEILPIVLLVAYSSVSVGAMIKLYHYRVRGTLLLFAFLLPIAYLLICFTAIKVVGKELEGKRKVRFYILCLKETPWLMPTFVAMTGKYLTGANFVRNMNIAFRDLFDDNHFKMKMS
ncbi:hypothetical protein [Brevibacillus fortis]|uniref:Uncharacterized protein n=1 Tax=Brevibacillus fortis TaxID=2126352 RepID=A0A2P7VPC4_9BACL|nr:hypothetical protein [Brevibacillus fortis]PSK01066.1 hypothetical protein C7R93_01115 [Brevibacillus fortis]